MRKASLPSTVAVILSIFATQAFSQTPGNDKDDQIKLERLYMAYLVLSSCSKYVYSNYNGILPQVRKLIEPLEKTISRDESDDMWVFVAESWRNEYAAPSYYSAQVCDGVKNAVLNDKLSDIVVGSEKIFNQSPLDQDKQAEAAQQQAIQHGDMKSAINSNPKYSSLTNLYMAILVLKVCNDRFSDQYINFAEAMKQEVTKEEAELSQDEVLKLRDYMVKKWNSIPSGMRAADLPNSELDQNCKFFAVHYMPHPNATQKDLQ